jgi:hypothetical protein
VFRREVERPEQQLRRRFSGTPGQLRQAEIEDLCLSALIDKDVARLDIAVNNARAVSCVETVGNLDPQLHNALHAQLLLVDFCFQGPAG